MRLAILPARGGSKRIPLKNIRPFAGRPIIAWPIEAAIRSGCFDRVVVSTDHEGIAEVAREFGADIPFLRPPGLSCDHTTTVAVIAHAIAWHQRRGVNLDEVCCIYATAAFLEDGDIRRGLDILRSSRCDYAISVVSYPHPIQRAIRINARNHLEMLHPEMASVRSQDLEPAFHDAGQFYWGLSEAWLSQDPIFLRRCAPVILPRHRVQDIDTEEDWECAERLFTAGRPCGEGQRNNTSDRIPQAC